MAKNWAHFMIGAACAAMASLLSRDCKKPVHPPAHSRTPGSGCSNKISHLIHIEYLLCRIQPSYRSGQGAEFLCLGENGSFQSTIFISVIYSIRENYQNRN